jgi:glycosyltransferase involved in cell wall biosynthesis
MQSMRICLVSHGFPPVDRTGVENYTACLARGLASRGHRVEVFAPRRSDRTLDLALHREERDGYAVNWLTSNRPPAGPRDWLNTPDVPARFGAFLDREKPELVHFQHVVKMGVDLIHEAHRRGLPTIYTAHDYFAVCHRYTLQRPDLSSCDLRGDSMQCALCDVALGYLDRLEKLGDYQMGAFPEQLTEAEQQDLESILDDDPEAAGISLERADAAGDLRRELDGLRSEAFAKLDLIVAPTRFLADELVRGGIDGERIEVLPYGIENEDLTAIAPLRRDPDRPLRFGFFGGLSKHKGVHILIEAFRRAALSAELTVWGYSSDGPYVERLREAAGSAGVRWGGSYEREDLPDLLGEVDVVIVPSTWVENFPIVIREAFSAGRPVITNRFGAMPESVRHEEDGLLVEPGDPVELAEAMRRCVEEEGLVERLASGIVPVKTVEEQVEELFVHYERLVAGAAQRRRDAAESTSGREIPASLQGFVARLDELGREPMRDLYDRALSGLARLRGRLEEREGEGIVPPFDLGDGSVKIDRLREIREARAVERGWLRHALDAQGEHLASQEEYLAHLQEQLDLHEQLRRDEEADRGRLESAIESLRTQLQEAETSDRRAQANLSETQGMLDKSEHNFRITAELGGAALHAQEALMGVEIGPLLDEINSMAGTVRERQWTEETFKDLIAAVRFGRHTAVRLADERQQRIEEIEQLQAQATHLFGELEWRAATMRRVKPALGHLIWVVGYKAGLGRFFRYWRGVDGERCRSAGGEESGGEDS